MIKVLNSLDYSNIHEYLLHSLENSGELEVFCIHCYQLLSDYLGIKNFLIYQRTVNEINFIYQHQCNYLNSIDYQSIINLVENNFIIHSELNLYSYHEFYHKNDHYYSWLMEEKIAYLSLSKICFQEENFANLWIEVNEKENLEEIQKILLIINKYLSLFFYHRNLKQKEEKLTLKAQRLAQAQKYQSTYLSHMNHELRTPIAAVIGFAKLLRQKLYGDLNAKQTQYVDAIYQSGTYLLELISDLLDLSKIQAQKEELCLETTIVQELCESALALVQTKAEEQNLTLNLVIESNVDSCFIDQRRLKQVLVNLLSNAVKFTERGTVTLKVSKNEHNILFKVIDTGIGIDQKSQKKLFQPFSQLNTHLHRQHRGTGLGLVISRELARLHGGDITLSSQVNQGSCFTVTIPHGDSVSKPSIKHLPMPPT